MNHAMTTEGHAPETLEGQDGDGTTARVGGDYLVHDRVRPVRVRVAHPEARNGGRSDGHPPARQSQLEAAAVALVARYCLGGRVLVTTHEHDLAVEVGLDTTLHELVEKVGEAQPLGEGVAHASVGLAVGGRRPLRRAHLYLEPRPEGVVVISPRGEHGHVALTQIGEVYLEYVRLLVEADNLETVTIGSAGVMDPEGGQQEWAVVRGLVDDSPVEQVHEVVARLGRTDPCRPAVEDGRRRLDYAGLSACMRATRRLIARHGVSCGEAVAVALPRSLENLVAQLGAFAAGCHVVLLDPSLPAERLKVMLKDSAVSLTLTSSGHTAVMRALEETSVRWAEPVVGVDQAPPGDHMVRFRDEAVSHIVYTSGSTGEPKAVELRHGPMGNTARVLASVCGMDRHSRGSWFCAPGVGMVEVDMFPILWAGGTVVVGPADVAADALRGVTWLCEQRITHTLQTTAVAEMMLKTRWPDGSTLVSMRVAGEKQRVWPPSDCSFQLLNVYGSSEANVVAVCDLTELAQAGVRRDKAPPVGRAVDNVNIYILDERLRPVPRHAVGELCISGASLSRGYLNRARETSERFLPNTVPCDPYPVLYRSGDLARLDADGLVEVVGRMDDEVKIEGFRVHPGDIEAVLSQLAGVAGCAVVPRERPTGGTYLVAHVEFMPTFPSGTPDAATLRRQLAESLPGYMVPSVFVFGELPLTRSGKVDRMALMALDDEAVLPVGALAKAPADAADEPEHLVAMLFSEVLGLPAVDTNVSFFELGGSSLQAARLAALLLDRHAVAIELHDLMTDPTPAGIARTWRRGEMPAAG